MSTVQIAILELDEGGRAGDRLRQTLLSARLGRNGHVAVDLLSVKALPNPGQWAMDALLIVAGEPRTPSGRILDVLTQLEEEDAPAVLLLTDAQRAEGDLFAYTCAVTERIDARDDLIAAKLEGILQQQTEINRLRREAKLAQRFQGGLRGEISRMHEELQLAAMVQREFLPRDLPAVSGVSFGALWRPAHYVSGDIYDVSRIDRDHVAVFIADAVGHGVPAALMTMVICRSIRSTMITDEGHRIVEPSEVLKHLNDEMIRRQGRSTRFATAAYGLVNCRDRTMRLAGAGHPPPLLIASDGAVRELHTSGGLLGIFEDETFEQIEVELAIDDRLLLYSDGFEQAFPNASADAYERRLPTARYREEFERLALDAESPDDVIRNIGRCLDDQAGSLHQADDLTLVCMHAGALIGSEDETEQSSRRSTVNPAWPAE